MEQHRVVLYYISTAQSNKSHVGVSVPCQIEFKYTGTKLQIHKSYCNQGVDRQGQLKFYLCYMCPHHTIQNDSNSEEYLACPAVEYIEPRAFSLCLTTTVCYSRLLYTYSRMLYSIYTHGKNYMPPIHPCEGKKR
jgi:hypothetical protein